MVRHLDGGARLSEHELRVHVGRLGDVGPNNAQIAEWFGEAPGNEKSCELTANKDHCDIFHAGDPEYWEDVYYWQTPTEDCADGRTDVKCTTYADWTAAWTEVRS